MQDGVSKIVEAKVCIAEIIIQLGVVEPGSNELFDPKADWHLADLLDDAHNIPGCDLTGSETHWINAWDEFVQRYHPTIRAWCLRWGSQASDADDVAQQVLLKLLSAMKKYHYNPTPGFRGWLKTVTHNAWVDFVASRRRMPGRDHDCLASIVDSHDAYADLEKQIEVMEENLKELKIEE